MVNVVLAGGGTAGHTSPLIATANALKEQDPDVQLRVIGTPKGLESRVIPAAGLKLEMITPVPLPRKPSADLAMVPVRLLKAVKQAKAILQGASADVVVGFGGYVSLPAYLAAKQLGLPVVAHEQNSVPGLANKVAAKLTDEIYSTFPDTPLKGAQCIGLPVREEITKLDRAAQRDEARAYFDLDKDKPTLLVSGGSQGARSINKAVRAAYRKLTAQGIQVLHVLGQKNFTEDMMSVADEKTGASYRPIAFVERMEQAYAAADLMLCRSGAGTVVETAVVGLPAVFVPLPHGNGEQAKNCEALVTGGGGRLLADSAISGDWVSFEIPPLITDTDELGRMSQKAKDLMPSNAAQTLAERVLGAARGRV